jgi:hypothetical protein
MSCLPLSAADRTVVTTNADEAQLQAVPTTTVTVPSMTRILQYYAKRARRYNTIVGFVPPAAGMIPTNRPAALRRGSAPFSSSRKSCTLKTNELHSKLMHLSEGATAQSVQVTPSSPPPPPLLPTAKRESVLKSRPRY